MLRKGVQLFKKGILMAKITIPVDAIELLDEEIGGLDDGVPHIERSVQGSEKVGSMWRGRVKVGKNWHNVSAPPSAIRPQPTVWSIDDEKDFLEKLKG